MLRLGFWSILRVIPYFFEVAGLLFCSWLSKKVLYLGVIGICSWLIFTSRGVFPISAESSIEGRFVVDAMLFGLKVNIPLIHFLFLFFPVIEEVLNVSLPDSLGECVFRSSPRYIQIILILITAKFDTYVVLKFVELELFNGRLFVLWGGLLTFAFSRLFQMDWWQLP